MSKTQPSTAAALLPFRQRRWLISRFCTIGQQRSLCVLALGGTILLGGCASFNNPDQSAAGTEQNINSSAGADTVGTRAIATTPALAMAEDVVRVARQIFNPIDTTLQFNINDSDPILAHYISEFASEGYGIQRVDADQGSHYFSYAYSEQSPTGSDDGVRLNASIGAVDLSRDYTISGNRSVSPASPFRLSGTRTSVIVQDENVGAFEVASSEFSRAVYVAAFDLEDQAPPVISLITDDLVSRVANETTQSASLQGLNSSRVEVNNLFYADQSNFSSILDNYEQIERQIVVFGNDSMVLGNTNKSLIKQWVDQRLQPDDLIGLVGCSNGNTGLDIGNEGLALGRAERVTQALLEEGVARDRILDEGCWAPVSAGDKFPARGVVLELWREMS